jgi:hypothetical protein
MAETRVAVILAPHAGYNTLVLPDHRAICVAPRISRVTRSAGVMGAAGDDIDRLPAKRPAAAYRASRRAR